jgi:hypothetical protein
VCALADVLWAAYGCMFTPPVDTLLLLLLFTLVLCC